MGTNKELQLLERLFTDLTREDNPDRLQTGLSDLFVRINTETGEISLYGDDDELLHSLVVFSWITNTPEPTEAMLSSLRTVIARLQSQGYWDHDLYERPFSIELVSDTFATIEHLLFLDDDLVEVSRPLLEGLDEDLDNFLDNLLGDLK